MQLAAHLDGKERPDGKHFSTYSAWLGKEERGEAAGGRDEDEG
jgi:hypothetical protein